MASYEIQIVWPSDYISGKKIDGNNDILQFMKEKQNKTIYSACLITLSVISPTLTGHSNSLDPDKTLSNIVSDPDSSRSILQQYFLY